MISHLKLNKDGDSPIFCGRRTVLYSYPPKLFGGGTHNILCSFSTNALDLFLKSINKNVGNTVSLIQIDKGSPPFELLLTSLMLSLK